MSLHLLADLIEHHKRFIARAVLNKEVWLLIQMATGNPLLFPGNTDAGVLVLPVWSDKAYAARHCINEIAAKGYEVVSMELTHFVNHNLYSFFKQGLLVGTNWNADLAGLEKHPLEVIDELVKAMQQQTKIKLERLQDVTECHALIYRLSQALAYHLIETEFNLPYAQEPSKAYLETETLKARIILEEAGYNIDELYPAEFRPQQ